MALFHRDLGVRASIHRWAEWLTMEGYVALIVDSLALTNAPTAQSVTRMPSKRSSTPLTLVRREEPCQRHGLVH